MARTKDTRWQLGLGADPAPHPLITKLQLQVNRFLAAPLPVTGILDRATATAVVTIVIQRFTRSFVEDPKNQELVRLFADANRHLGNPVPWVAPRVAELTDMLRDYGDFIGRPAVQGDRGMGRMALPLALVAGGALLLYVSRPPRRRR